MRKTERIYTMMRFINNRSFFTLKDLMTEFSISRATAIRDVREIEALGLPLTATPGRDGGYAVLTNGTLPPIRFTDDQLKALFIAFMASRNRQLPYLKSRQTLAENLIGLMPQAQQDELLALNDLLMFEGTNPAKTDLVDLADFANPMLDRLLALVLTDRFVSLTTATGVYAGYVLHLVREAGSWQVELVDLATRQTITLAIGTLTAVAALPPEKRVSSAQIRQWQDAQDATPNLILHLDAAAIAQYRKYHPLGARLAYLDPFQMTGELTLHVTAATPLAALVSWLLFLGPSAKLDAAPRAVRAALAMRVRRIAAESEGEV